MNTFVSKTFLSVLSEYLTCMFKPNIKVFLCAPQKGQSIKIAREKIEEILTRYPLLRRELVKESYAASNDYLTLVFKNDSRFDIVSAANSTRGGRRNAGIIDEVRDHDGQQLNEIVLPLLNVDRTTLSGAINPYELQQCQIYITSAGMKNSYAYTRLIELLQLSIIAPKTAFVWGCTYKIPLMHKLLNKTFLQEIKMSSTYSSSSFAREYLSAWSGGGDTSWFNYDRLNSYRKLVNPENSRKERKGSKVFYLLSMDVGRLKIRL